jgi:HTH-type transcriptional regulator / antitoxin HigA
MAEGSFILQGCPIVSTNVECEQGQASHWLSKKMLGAKKCESMTTTLRQMPVEYFRLVESFPLVRIESKKHLAEAIDVIDHLLAQAKLGKGGQAYLDALSDLVESYENEREPIPDVSDVEMLSFLMEGNGYSQPKLALASGISQSTISAILSGKRQMTKGHSIRLARIFNVSPALFLPAK